MKLDMVYRKDGRGQYLWDPYLWVLAAGAIVFLTAFIFALLHFTPPN